MRYGNPEIHGLAVSVDKKGLLGFEIRAGGNSETQGSGRDMFISAMKRLEKEGVDVSNIRGTWIQGTESVNAKQYLSNLKLMPEADAARNTWTGRIASDFGFSKVESVKTSYGITTVIFGK
jgi:filamentous hemagglutinin